MGLLQMFFHTSTVGRGTVHSLGRGRFVVVLLGSLSCAPGVVTTTPLPGPSSPTVPVTQPRNYAVIESEVLAALNRARTDPRGMAATLDGLLSYFNGRVLKRPHWPIAIQTNEGTAAVREASAALRSQTPVGPLTQSTALTKAARDHATDQARTGAVGHTGADGSSTKTRAERYGTWQISLSENIDYSQMVRGSDVIENLIVDDGVPDRGHRRNIYDPTVKVVGIACGPHPRYAAMCVMVHAGGFVPR
jgi:uncharacterized protein YkwD